MKVVDIRAYKDLGSRPLLILIDVQREYVSAYRPLALANHSAAIANCRQLLERARANKIPVAFVRWAQHAKTFTANGAFTGWIDGFAPSGSDMVFERAGPSCYANRDFAEMMAHGGGDNAVIAGFTGAVACLSTIVEGAQRGHRFTFIGDASLSHAVDDRSEQDVHEMATVIISHYGTVTNTKNWMASDRSPDASRQILMRSDHVCG